MRIYINKELGLTKNENPIQGAFIIEELTDLVEAAVLEEGVHRSKGATLYTTLSPCRWCSKVIIAAGIKRVVYDEKYQHSESEGLLLAQDIKIDRININP